MEIYYHAKFGASRMKNEGVRPVFLGGGGGEKYDEERGQIGLKTSYIFQYRFKE